MKRVIALLSMFVFLSASAYAVERVGPDAAREAHRQEMKKIKDAQRQNRKSSTDTAKTPSKMDEFMKKEGDRSGLGSMGERMGNWTKNLNPMPFFKQQNEAYKARKAAAGQAK